MPRYEYECPVCQARTEKTRPMSESDAPGPKCEKHTHTAMVRVVSRLGMVRVVSGKKYA